MGGKHESGINGYDVGAEEIITPSDESSSDDSGEDSEDK